MRPRQSACGPLPRSKTIPYRKPLAPSGVQPWPPHPARVILRLALAEERAAPQDLGLAIHRRFAPLGGVDLPVAPREPVREPPSFDR